MIFAIVKNSVVQNVVEAENSIAFPVLFPEADEFVEVTIDSGFPAIGLQSKGGKFQQFASWTFDKKLGEWVAPKPKPEITPEQGCYWDESTLNWVVYDLTEPELES